MHIINEELDIRERYLACIFNTISVFIYPCNCVTCPNAISAYGAKSSFKQKPKYRNAKNKN